MFSRKRKQTAFWATGNTALPSKSREVKLLLYSALMRHIWDVVLDAGLSSKRYRHMSPGKGHKDDEWSGAYDA